MKNYQVITLFPELIEAFANSGVVSQAIKNRLAVIQSINPREFVSDAHKTVDARPYGGGDGMIMLIKPIQDSLAKAVKNSNTKPYVIYLSPQGKVLNVETAKRLAAIDDVVFISGRYGGIDQRIINTHVDEELSIGDYVLSGGEMAACVAMDVILRWVPGVLGHADSVSKDSFSGPLLEGPSFTRPQDYEGQKVPEVLLSGDHKRIQEWRDKVALLTTQHKRPELFAQLGLSVEKKTQLDHFFQSLSDEDKLSLGFKGVSK